MRFKTAPGEFEYVEVRKSKAEWIAQVDEHERHIVTVHLSSPSTVMFIVDGKPQAFIMPGTEVHVFDVDGAKSIGFVSQDHFCIRVQGVKPTTSREYINDEKLEVSVKIGPTLFDRLSDKVKSQTGQTLEGGSVRRRLPETDLDTIYTTDDDRFEEEIFADQVAAAKKAQAEKTEKKDPDPAPEKKDPPDPKPADKGEGDPDPTPSPEDGS